MTTERVIQIDETFIAGAKRRGRLLIPALAVLYVAITLPGFVKDQAWVAFGVMTLLVGVAVGVGLRIGRRKLHNTRIRITDGDAIAFHGSVLDGAVFPLWEDAVRIRPLYRRSVLGTVDASWRITNCRGAFVSVPQRFYTDLPKQLANALGESERVCVEQALHVGFPSAALRAFGYLAGFAALLAVWTVLLRSLHGRDALLGALSAWLPIAAFLAVYLWRRNRMKSLGKGR